MACAARWLERHPLEINYRGQRRGPMRYMCVAFLLLLAGCASTMMSPQGGSQKFHKKEVERFNKAWGFIQDYVEAMGEDERAAKGLLTLARSETEQLSQKPQLAETHAGGSSQQSRSSPFQFRPQSEYDLV